MTRKIRPVFHIPGDGDPDLLGELANTCALLAPVLAALARHEGAAAANFLFPDGPAPAFAILLQALAVPLAEIAAAYTAFWQRLDEHHRHPGARRGADWQPVPDMVTPLRAGRALFHSLFREGDLAFAGAEPDALAAERALAALDRGIAVIDDKGNVIRARKEKP